MEKSKVNDEQNFMLQDSVGTVAAEGGNNISARVKVNMDICELNDIEFTRDEVWYRYDPASTEYYRIRSV